MATPARHHIQSAALNSLTTLTTRNQGLVVL